MLLKNFRGLIPLLGSSSYSYNKEFCKAFTTTSNVNPTEGIAPPNLTTNLRTITQIIYNNTNVDSTTTSSSFAVVLGDGDEPPTVDDYKLSGNCIDSTKMSFTANATPSLGIDSITFSVTFRNISTETITIKEIGLAIVPKGTSSTQAYAILLTRDVLQEPVVLEPQGIKSFEISIDTMSFVTGATNA